MCQGLGPKKHDEISEIDQGAPSLGTVGLSSPVLLPHAIGQVNK